VQNVLPKTREERRTEETKERKPGGGGAFRVETEKHKPAARRGEPAEKSQKFGKMARRRKNDREENGA